MATIKLIGSDGCSFTTDGIEKVMIKCGDDFQPLQDSGLCIVLMERITSQTKTIIHLKDENERLKKEFDVTELLILALKKQEERIDTLENNPMILLYSSQPQTFTTTGPIVGTTTTSATTGLTTTSGTQENPCKNCQDMAVWVKAMKIINPLNSQTRGIIQSPCILCKDTYRPEVKPTKMIGTRCTYHVMKDGVQELFCTCKSLSECPLHSCMLSDACYNVVQLKTCATCRHIPSPKGCPDCVICVQFSQWEPISKQ